VDSRKIIGQRLLLAFKGMDVLTPEIIHAIREYQPAGITLFRSLNIDNPSQLRALTASLKTLARELGYPPLLIATDQEGGQLMAVGDGTPLPGNMALGATGSEDLARRSGEVLGRELAALGVNVNYAPCVDVNVNPLNPVVGVRSFGENPETVSWLSAAMISGIQSQGVAATAKHFPGHGDTSADSHLGMPIIPHGLERLRAVEFPPFRASIHAGVKLIMTAHVGLTAVDGPQAPPASLSKNIINGILRSELGYRGVIVTDALDMHAIQQGSLLGGEAVRAAAAGADLLLVTSDPDDQKRVHTALLEAASDGRLDSTGLNLSLQRILELKKWVAGWQAQPDLDVIRSPAHMQVAREVAEASITLVRNETGILPLRLTEDQRIAVIVPRPLDLTPADTSSYVAPMLAESIREYHPRTDKFVIPHIPRDSDIRDIMGQVHGYDLVIVGTLNAFNQPAQSELVRLLLEGSAPVIVVALRLPYDLVSFPDAPAYICTYSILEPSMQMLAKVLFGLVKPLGRLPVSIPGMYSSGFSVKQD
jgi:beta-N-acetylhexosaminidase